MKILLSTNMYPSKNNPQLGVFIKSHVDIMKDKYNICNIICNENEIATTLNQKILKYLKFFKKLIIFSLTKKFDLIHAHYSFPTGFLTSFLKIITKKKMILTVHGSDVQSDIFDKYYLFLINKYTFYATDTIICVSAELKSQIVNKYNIDENKIHIIDMGFNDKIFFDYKKSYLKSTFNITFIGRLIDIKGFDVLIRAINSFTDDMRSKVKCVAYGDGSEKNKYLKMIDKYELTQNIMIKGFATQNKIASVINESDVVVVPSLREGFGLVAIESLACGVPVVCSRVGGLKYIVKEGCNGYFFEKNNSEDLKLKLQKILKDNKIKKQDCIDSVSNYKMISKVNDIIKIYKIYDEK